MKYLLFVLLLVAVLITAGCVSEKTSNAVTLTQTTSQVPTPILTITPQKIAVSTPPQTYKTAELLLALNINPTYGFKMDYPSDWTYKKARSYTLVSSASYIHESIGSEGYIFLSPDEKSNVEVYFENVEGTVIYLYPLDTPTENSKTSWSNNVIKSKMKSYCLDGAGNAGKPGECPSDASATSYLHMRLISNETVTLSGNVKANKLVFAPDARDKSMNWQTGYLMHIGDMQGYNFTVPDRFSLAVKVDGPVWDYRMGGQIYTIWLNTPSDQVNATSDIFDHMIKSFEVIS